MYNTFYYTFLYHINNITKMKSDPFEMIKTFIRSLPDKKENGTVTC